MWGQPNFLVLIDQLLPNQHSVGIVSEPSLYAEQGESCLSRARNRCDYPVIRATPKGEGGLLPG